MVKILPTVTGKKAEMRFISALIDRGFCAFIPIVDLGIDVVAEKFSNRSPPLYYAFQIKTSAFHLKDDAWYWTADEAGFRCAPNVYYVLVFEDSGKLPHGVKPNSDINACIIPSTEIRKEAHWTTYPGGRSFDVRISKKMLSDFARWSKRKTNSGLALRHFNDWDCI